VYLIVAARSGSHAVAYLFCRNRDYIIRNATITPVSKWYAVNYKSKLLPSDVAIQLTSETVTLRASYDYKSLPWPRDDDPTIAAWSDEFTMERPDLDKIDVHGSVVVCYDFTPAPAIVEKKQKGRSGAAAPVTAVVPTVRRTIDASNVSVTLYQCSEISSHDVDTDYARMIFYGVP